MKIRLATHTSNSVSDIIHQIKCQAVVPSTNSGALAPIRIRRYIAHSLPCPYLLVGHTSSLLISYETNKL